MARNTSLRRLVIGGVLALLSLLAAGSAVYAGDPVQDGTVSEERCEFPVLWDQIYFTLLPKQCKNTKNERGTLQMTPILQKDEWVGAVIEWRIARGSKLTYVCMNRSFNASHVGQTWLAEHTVKKSQDLQSVRVYVNPGGWDNLSTSADSACIRK